MKKLLLAFILLAAAVLVQVDPAQQIDAESVNITNPIEVAAADADMTPYGIADNTVYKEISLQESLRFFDENGSGILFFAKPDGSECKIAAQTLYSAAEELGIPVYYVNTAGEYSDEDYQKLSEDIQETFQDDGTGTRSFFVPDVIAVKNGDITDYHVSLVEGVTVTSDGVELSDEQKASLKDAYTQLILSAKD